MDELLVDVIEAARRLSVGRSQVYELLASGQLPRVKIGRRTLVPVQALRDWVQGQMAAPLAIKGVEAAQKPR